MWQLSSGIVPNNHPRERENWERGSAYYVMQGAQKCIFGVPILGIAAPKLDSNNAYCIIKLG